MLNLCQAFDCLEFYAGKANLSRCLKLTGCRTGSLDLKYGEDHLYDAGTTNPMDILSASGFGLLGHYRIQPFWNSLHVIVLWVLKTYVILYH